MQVCPMMNLMVIVAEMMIMMMIACWLCVPPLPPRTQSLIYNVSWPMACLKTLYRLYLSLVWIFGSKTYIFAKVLCNSQGPNNLC